MNERFDDLVRALRNSSLHARKSAVVRIRKIRRKAFGPPLLDAFQRERKHENNWEILYHMIMALGEMGFEPAYPVLDAFSRLPFEATILYTALGEALVRLGRRHPGDASPLRAVMERDNVFLLDGAFRAVTTLHMGFDADFVAEVFRFQGALEDPESEERRRFFPAGDATVCRSPHLHRFLRRCLEAPCERTRKIAEEAMGERAV